MGNRLVKGSPRFGIPRDMAKEAEARKQYETRSTRRPMQFALVDGNGKFLGWGREN